MDSINLKLESTLEILHVRKQVLRGEPSCLWSNIWAQESQELCPGIGCGNPHQIGKGAFRGLLLGSVEWLVFSF